MKIKFSERSKIDLIKDRYSNTSEIDISWNRNSILKCLFFKNLYILTRCLTGAEKVLHLMEYCWKSKNFWKSPAFGSKLSNFLLKSFEFKEFLQNTKSFPIGLVRWKEGWGVNLRNILSKVLKNSKKIVHFDLKILLDTQFDLKSILWWNFW